jgi:myo-inositol 2-dehydrogenase / D-chiro-inositol 1-dehydrogenase
VIGVGIVGLGPVTQAIHLPTLARLADDFRVVNVVDIDEATAQAVADPLDARWSTSFERLLADERVDVVAICSPHALHVAQVIASLEAGKAVLCEKPLTMDLPGLAALREAAGAATSPLMVGWMHLYDPVVETAISSWTADGHRASAIRVSAVLPPNHRFEDAATEVLPRAPVTGGRGGPALREALLSLAIHDLPLIRRLLPVFPAPLEITHASWRAPWGYLVLARVGDARVELHASLGHPGRPCWTLEATSPAASLTLDFPPSYVHVGSATSRLARAGGRVDEQTETPEDGYDREWRRMAGAIREGAVGALDDTLLDAEFALAFADAADRWAGANAA